MSKASTLTTLMRLEEPVRPDDQVATARREMKFVFPHADIEKLTRVLEANTQPVQFGHAHDSQVNSIYFDDPWLRACQESLDGVDYRYKLRLRWYDQPMPDDLAFFEIKTRENLHIRKQRLAFKCQGPLDSATYPQLIDSLLQQLDPLDASRLQLRCEPTVLVSYKRRHFRNPTGQTRLTLDYDIVAYDQSGRLRPARKFGVQVGDQVVIEAKTPTEDDRTVRRLLHPLNLRLSRFSKYVQSCCLMGWPQLVDRYD